MTKLKKTKIIATLGPATNSTEMIERMVLAGANIFRLNTSHGDHTTIKKAIKNIRDVERKLNQFIGILLDLQGPKIRVGDFEKGFIEIHNGDKLVLTTQNILGNEKIVPIQYKKFHMDVKPGDRILLDDGNLSVLVKEVKGKNVTVEVVNGGILSNNKGLNLPEASISISPITKKDREDLKVGLENGVDFVALSFVKGAQEIKTLRRLISKQGSTAEIVAKIERHEAVKNLDEIIDEANAVMVARGDMGVEISYERVPLVQLDILSKANRLGKPVIVATQMLESMINHHRPTRAEVSDVANAVASYADAIMLSAETAVGQYPIAAIKAMTKTALKMEAYQKSHFKILPWWSPPGEIAPITHGITYAADHIGELLNASSVIGFTESGETLKQVSKPRPNIPIFGFTPNIDVARRINLVRGAYPFLIPEKLELKKPLKYIFGILKEKGLIKLGDRVILTSGIPMGVSGSTNMIRVETVR